MSYRSLTLPHTRALPRQLILARTASICTAAILLPGCTYQIAFGAAERSRLRIGNQGGMRTLWVGESAFDLVEAEAKAVAEFFEISLPVLPAMAGASLPSPSAPAVAGAFSRT